MTEIYRRHELLELSAKQVSTIVDAAFDDLSASEFPNRVRWLSLLAHLHICGDLTDEQNSRLAKELVQLRPRGRNVIRRGDPMAIDIFWEAQSPNSGYQIAFGTENRKVVVDGQVVHREDKYQPLHWAYPRGTGVAAVVCNDTATLSPGIRNLTFTASVSIVLYDAYSRVDHTSPRWGTYDFSYSQQFEVLAGESAETIHFQTDAALENELANVIEFRGLNVYVGECSATDPTGNANDAVIDGWIRLGQKQYGPSTTLPVGVAFELILEVGEFSFDLGDLLCPEGESLSHYVHACISFPGGAGLGRPPTLTEWRSLLEGEEASIILRSNRQLAHLRAAMTCCWEGELRLGQVPIVVSDFRKGSSRSEDGRQEKPGGTKEGR